MTRLALLLLLLTGCPTFPPVAAETYSYGVATSVNDAWLVRHPLEVGEQQLVRTQDGRWHLVEVTEVRAAGVYRVRALDGHRFRLGDSGSPLVGILHSVTGTGEKEEGR